MKSISLMLVDDDPILRDIVRCYLRERWGEEATVVGTVDRGAEAAARALNLRPDIVLIDLGLRDLSALEVIAQLRRDLPDVGIIALGRLNVDGYRQAAEQAGADAFVFKMRVADDLMPAVRRVMHSKQAECEAAEGAARRAIPSRRKGGAGRGTLGSSTSGPVAGQKARAARLPQR